MDDHAEKDPFGMDNIQKFEAAPLGVGHVTRSLAISARGDRLACTDMLGRLHVFEARSGKRLVFLKPNKEDKEWFTDVVFHPSKNLLACFHGTNVMEIRDAETGKLVRSLEGASGVSVRNRGSALLGSGDLEHDNRKKIWGWDSDKPIQTVMRDRDLYDGTVESTEIVSNASGTTVATVSCRSPLQLWDVKSGKEIRRLAKKEDEIWDVAFSPDGQLIVGSDLKGFIRIWEVANGTLKHRFRADAKDIAQIIFSPDGKTLVSCGTEKVIRRFDPVTGKKLPDITTDERIDCLVFSPDGTRLWSGGYGGLIRQWDTKTAAEIRPKNSR